jgi:hypothetical protein
MAMAVPRHFVSFPDAFEINVGRLEHKQFVIIILLRRIVSVKEPYSLLLKLTAENDLNPP